MSRPLSTRRGRTSLGARECMPNVLMQAMIGKTPISVCSCGCPTLSFPRQISPIMTISVDSRRLSTKGPLGRKRSETGCCRLFRITLGHIPTMSSFLSRDLSSAMTVDNWSCKELGISAFLRTWCSTRPSLFSQISLSKPMLQTPKVSWVKSDNCLV